MSDSTNTTSPSGAKPVVPAAPQATQLDAKLHQGYDPTSEHAVSGRLLGNVAYLEPQETGKDFSLLGLYKQFLSFITNQGPASVPSANADASPVLPPIADVTSSGTNSTLNINNSGVVANNASQQGGNIVDRNTNNAAFAGQAADVQFSSGTAERLANSSAGTITLAPVGGGGGNGGAGNDNVSAAAAQNNAIPVLNRNTDSTDGGGNNDNTPTSNNSNTGNNSNTQSGGSSSGGTQTNTQTDGGTPPNGSGNTGGNTGSTNNNGSGTGNNTDNQNNASSGNTNNNTGSGTSTNGNTNTGTTQTDPGTGNNNQGTSNNGSGTSTDGNTNTGTTQTDPGTGNNNQGTSNNNNGQGGTSSGNDGTNNNNGGGGSNGGTGSGDTGTGNNSGGNGNTGNGGNGGTSITITPPTISTAPVQALENQPVAISIGLGVDPNVATTTIVTITGVPVGGTLSAGTHNSDGTWTLNAGDLSGLTLSLPNNYTGSLWLSVTATSSASGVSASANANLAVTVDSVAFAPTLGVTASAGLENTGIPLHVDAALATLDNAGVLSVTLSDLPAGATLSAGTHNSDGSWTLTVGQLAGLKLYPPADYTGTLQTTVTATSTENGTSASTSTALQVVVESIAVAPVLTVQAATGNENGPIPLTISTALAPTDSNGVLQVTISNLPAGATLSAGTPNSDGTWTLTAPQLAGLTLTPPANYTGTLALGVTATSSENGTSASTITTLPVAVQETAVPPSLVIAPASGLENAPVSLSISAVPEGMDPTQVLSVTISGLPAGASLSAGTHNSDGSWTLTSAQLSGLTLTPPQNWNGDATLTVTANVSEHGTSASVSGNLALAIAPVALPPLLSAQPATGIEDQPVSLQISASLAQADAGETLGVTISGLPAGATLSAGTQNSDGSWSLTTAQLSGLTLTPPTHWSGNLNISVTATATENGTTASTVTNLPVSVSAVAVAPVLSLLPATGDEDTAIPLVINATDINVGSADTIAVTISGLPAGATLSAGTQNSDGSWTLTSAQLSGLNITPPTHWSGDFTLGITATSTDNGTTASVSSSLAVSVTAVAHAPVLSLQPATGAEDNPLALSINAAGVDTGGNETVGVTISGLPTGATLSVGTHNSDGSWTLTTSQLAGLTLTPPDHWSGSFNLSVTATASENGTSANTVATLPVTVTGVVSPPNLFLLPASGQENGSLTLSIGAALTNNDVGETLSVTVTGVPTGATLSAGTQNSDGSWTLTTAQLSGLTLTPPANWSGNFNLTVTANAAESGEIASTSGTLPVTVAGVAVAPSLSLASASGNEDTNIPLHISAALNDTDTNESLAVTITGVPAGATLSAGTHNSDGSWTLTPAQLANLTLAPPAHWSGSFSLSVSAETSVNGTTASAGGTLPVTVNGVAEAPVLAVSAATGIENSAIPLSIAASLGDIDPGETLSVTVTGVPAGATLSAGTHNADGSYTLTAAQLSGLTLTPPSNWNGTVDLSVTATTSVNGTTDSVNANLPVHVTGIALTPVLAVTAAAGLEGAPVSLNIGASLAIPDPAGTLSVTITGVPAGATLSAGTHNSDGSYTLTTAQLSGLTLTHPASFSGSMDLSVSATATENGTSASASASLPVTVTAVAHAPSLSLNGATGFENAPIALTIGASLAATDSATGGALSITVAGLPSGATLSAGTHNSDGTWTLTQAQLAGLTLTPPVNWNGTLPLTVTATSSENGTAASVSGSMQVAVTGIAFAPTLSVSPATGAENGPIALNINAALSNTDPAESLGITLSGVPTGAMLSAGTHNSDGTWTLTPVQLSGLTLTPPPNYNGTLGLTVTATASENGTVASTSASLPVVVTGIALAPLLTLHSVSGNQDTSIALGIAAGLAVADPAENLAVTIAGVPAGATLSAGTHNSDGTWTLTAAQLSGLTLTPPTHWSGSLNLTVTATTSENGTSASTSGQVAVTVNGVATAPVLSVAAASGNQDTAIALNITSSGVDTGGNETLGVTIAGVPAGATLSAGTHNSDGTWTLTAAQLSGLTITPPLHYHGALALTVTSTASENGTSASTAATLPVTVNGVAATPVLSIQPATGVENAPVALAIGASLPYVDASESLSVTITGVPAGAALSAGTHNSDGSWTLTSAQLTGLTLTPPANWNGNFTLGVAATTTEGSSVASTSASLPVAVTGIALTPNLSVQAAAGNQDSAIALNISSSLATNDPAESLSVTIAGVPTGATLSAGTHNSNGTWTLTQAQLSGLTITPPTHWSGSLNLTVTATTSENGTSASTSGQVAVTVNGVATAPVLSVAAASGNQDTAIALNITSSGVDTGGNETLAVTIAGVPTGATLSAGTHNSDGSWTLTSAQLSGLTITPPLHYHGALALTVTSTASENSTSASTAATLPVTIIGVAATPILSVQAATGVENAPVVLNIGASLPYADPSEVVSVTVTGIPAGASLSAGTHNSDGSWTLTPAQLTGLTLTPPANWNGNFTLGVTATTTEGSSVASTSTNLPVAVSGIALAPTLSVQAAAGNQDSAIALTITSSLATNDPAESLSVTIAGVPTGATLSAGTHNSNGTWTLTQAQLTGLTITPPAHWSGSIPLTVTATATENGTTATSAVSLPVTVSGFATTPSLSVSAATGNQDTAIALNIASSGVDTGGNETLAITVAGVPTGATLSAGTNNGNGSWTLTPAQLSGLTITPPLHYHGALALTVTSTASENGTSASAVTTLPVTVTGVAATPILAVLAATGVENAPVALSIGASLPYVDPSEIVSVAVTGVPAGASLSAGTHNSDGSWTLTPAQLTGLTLTPPANWNGNFTLGVTATTTEGSSVASASANLSVAVTGIALTPNLSVQAATGSQDSAIALNISSSLATNDPAESLSVTIAGVPTGATLSAGTHNSNGTWTLTQAQLSGLTITPPTHWSGSIPLTVTATATENGTTATSVAALPVTVNGFATTPSLAVSAAVGKENSSIPLAITAAGVDLGGTETVSVTITGVPTGATLSAGTHNSDGSWTLTSAQLSGLTLTPPANWNGSLTLGVTATASENSTTASATTSLPVTVTGIAFTPTITMYTALGNENSSIPLSIAAALSNTDPLETLSVTISGLPTGATLSAGTHNSDGSYTLTAAQLSGLTITPPSNYTGTINLTVTATAAENSTTASLIGTLPVTVQPTAATPALSVSAASGNEGAAIALPISSALGSADGTETLSLLVSGVPAGATLSAGTHNADGTWSLTPANLTGLTMTTHGTSGSVALTVAAIATENDGNIATTSSTLNVSIAPVAAAPALTVAAAAGVENTVIPLSIVSALNDIDPSETLSVTISGLPTGATLSAGTHNSNGSWTLTPAQLAGLTLTPPTNSDTGFTLTVAATATNGTASTTQTASLPVTIAGVATAPTVSATGSVVAINTNASLTISGALTNPDGTESLTYTIGGVPDGFALTAGTNNGNNTWTVTQSQLSGLQLISPYNFQGTLGLTATAVAHETDGSIAQSAATAFSVGVGNTAALSINLGLGVGVAGIGVGMAAGITVNTGGLTAANGIDVMENSSITLTDAVNLLSLTPGIVSVTLSGLPTGATLSAGTNNGNGSWTLTGSQLNNLVLTPAANSDADFTITATAKTTILGVTLLSVPLVTTQVHVIGVAQAPSLTVANATGTEDSAGIPISITSALPLSDGSENLSITLEGLPTGFIPSVGTNNGNGTWSLTPSQLSSLTIKPAAGFTGDATFTVVATDTEREGDSITTTATGHIHVNAAAFAPTISAVAATGTEDQNVPINLSIGLADSSEQLSSVTISGLPTGATLSAGTHNSDGSYTLTAAQLSGLTLTPPTHWSGDASLSITAVSQVGSSGPTASATTTMGLHVNAVAYAPVATASDATGQAGSQIGLHLSATPVTTGNAETYSAVISGLPSGFTLSEGQNNGNGSWTLHVQDLSTVAIVAPSSFSGDVHLTMTASTTETSNGASASSASQNFTVHVTPSSSDLVQTFQTTHTG